MNCFQELLIDVNSLLGKKVSLAFKHHVITVPAHISQPSLVGWGVGCVVVWEGATLSVRHKNTILSYNRHKPTTFMVSILIRAGGWFTGMCMCGYLSLD